MRNLLLCLLFIPFGMGCSKELTDQPEMGRRAVALTVSVCPEKAEIITRSVDENSIQDVNLCLQEKNTGILRHAYATGSTLKFLVPAGEYTLYALANLHRKLEDEMTNNPADFSFSYDNNTSDIPMSCVRDITISSEAASVTLPPIHVSRSLARINYSLSVDPAVSYLTIQSVQLCSVPQTIRPFVPDDTLCPDDKSLYTDMKAVNGASARNGTYYIPANPQGQNTSITDQHDKNTSNAPACATFLRIKATHGSEVFTYQVYLGSNNTTDFNVNGNTVYNLSIRIMGTDQVDTRMNSYRIIIREEENSVLPDYLTGGDGITGEIGVENANPDDIFIIVFDLFQSGTFINSDGRQSQYYTITGDEHFYYDVDYNPGIFTTDNNELNYRIEVTDPDGFSQRFTMVHDWCNGLGIYTRYFQSGPSGGTVEVTGSLRNELFTTSDYEYRVIGCLDQNPTLTAIPKAGCAFLGWYSDQRYTRLLSSDPVYHYVPEKSYASIYARFSTPQNVSIKTRVQDVIFTCSEEYKTDTDTETFVVPYGAECTMKSKKQGYIHYGWWDTFSATGGNCLSTDEIYKFKANNNITVAQRISVANRLDNIGTANCYLASALNTTYAFKGWVKGNNKATTNITPTFHSCDFARVLWETGIEQGAVIRTTDANGADVIFTTGSDWGNAVIGVFDKDSILQWSYHIWVTPYDPDATARNFGGRIFMDRNLGAMGVSPGADSRGMLYQWGRKDPFVGTAGTSVNPFLVVYKPGYEYDYAGGRIGGNTLVYSILHPTHFITGIERDGSEGPYIGDWVIPSNPNWWGNASNGYYSDENDKSIYDPCPPGWRVPDRQAWSDAGFSSGEIYSKGGFVFGNNFYLPMCGIRLAGTGTISFTGSQGYYWTNTPQTYHGGEAYALELRGADLGYTINPQATLLGSVGASIRCVKE